MHPRFKPNTYRLSMARALLREFKNYKIKIFGRKWGKLPHKPPILGNIFLNEINKAKISIDLQQDWVPLAHRMFECMACGTPVITRSRPEVIKMLPNHNKILVYTDYKSLALQVHELLNDDKLRNKLRKRMYKNTRTNHNIDNRISKLLKDIKKL